jgi:hypothetical protein
MVQGPGEDNINSELCKYAPEEFKLRLSFLNIMYKENCIRNEWRNEVAFWHKLGLLMGTFSKHIC